MQPYNLLLFNKLALPYIVYLVKTSVHLFMLITEVRDKDGVREAGRPVLEAHFALSHTVVV